MKCIGLYNTKSFVVLSQTKTLENIELNKAEKKVEYILDNTAVAPTTQEIIQKENPI